MTGQTMARASRKPFMAELQHRKRAGGPGAPADEAPDTIPLLSAAPISVSVDQSEVLKAIADLGGRLDRFLNTDHTEIERIQVEIADISGRIKATKAEMAALRHPLSAEDKFLQASEELSAVVSATESATNSIMACAEAMDEIVHELKAQLPDGYQAGRVNDMGELVIRIFEACNFQDLTGQRITKVVRALSFIEERVDAMMGVWNKKEFETMPLPPGIARKDGELELHGPNEVDQNKGMISQDDIDKLFG